MNLTREQEDAAAIVWDTPGMPSDGRALATIAVVYGAQARRWVLYRVRNGYAPGWSGNWPEDLGIALDYYGDRLTEPLSRQLRSQFRAGPAHQLQVMEEQLRFDKLILMANAKAHQEAQT
jgi:hypothetical protein